MDKLLDKDGRGDSAAALLWRRAPWWRAAVVAACATSAAAFVGWSGDQSGTPVRGESSRSPTIGTAAPSTPPAQNELRGPQVTRMASSGQRAIEADSSPALPKIEQVMPIARADGPTPPVTPGFQPPQSIVNSTVPGIQPQPLTTVSDSEEQILATCHPHLLTAPPSVPQIFAPSGEALAYRHLKIHFWVNGSGFVTRDAIAAATFGTAEEQEAELQYVRNLTFAIPNTKECQSREIELFGDFIERPKPGGGWSTLVSLYPRYSFANDGSLLSRD